MKLSFYKRNKYVPILFVLFYLFFTLILFAAGPLDWKISNPLQFYFFQFAYIISILLGYQFSIDYPSNEKKQWKKYNEIKLIKYLKPLLIINLSIEFLNAFRGYGLSCLDFRAFYNMVIEGIAHPGAGYALRYERAKQLSGSQVVGGTAMTFFNYIWSFIDFNIVLLGILYFNKLNKAFKVVVALTCGLIITFFISVGTNIGAFRIILAIGFFYIVNTVTKSFNHYSYLKVSPKVNKKKIIIISIISFTIIVIYFVNSMKSRGGILKWNNYNYNIGGIGLNKDSIFFRVLPPALHLPLVSITGYLAQGYYGCSLCMKLQWKPTFGLGSSMNLGELLSTSFFDIQKRTFQYRSEQIFGWDSHVQWHSMYSWFANDVSFWGVIIIMFILGYMLSLSYKDSLISNNPFAKLVFYYCCFMCLFIPCNNQVFQTTYIFFAFIASIFLWIRSRNGKTIIPVYICLGGKDE